MIKTFAASPRLKLLALLFCVGLGAAACDQAPVEGGGGGTGTLTE